MKKLSLILAMVMLFTVLFTGVVYADEEYKIESVTYDGFVLHGEVTVPEEEFFARVTFFLDSGTFIVIVTDIVDGEFCVHVSADCVHIAVILVDQYDAFVLGTFQAFATYGFDV